MCSSPSPIPPSSSTFVSPMKNNHLCVFIFLSLLLFLLLVPASAGGGHGHTCEGEEPEDDHDHDHDLEDSKNSTRTLRIAAIFIILVAGALGVLVPVLGRWIPALRPEKDLFFVIKAFASGVILATAFVHVLPEAFERLGSECLNENPWQKFPFTGFIAMLSALGSLMVDSIATGYYKRRYASSKTSAGSGDDEEKNESNMNAPQHVHAHWHGMVPAPEKDTGLSVTIRNRIIAQVLELGIVVHSVIIGITLGTSDELSTIRPLLGAVTFHQFFEGMGLGSCIVQAKFKATAVSVMAFFYSTTTPVGIAIGIAISSSYNPGSNTALIVQGVLDAAAAGILVYMSLVDLLAVDFMSDRMQKGGMLQILSYVALFLGVAAMSILAKWE